MVRRSRALVMLSATLLCAACTASTPSEQEVLELVRIETLAPDALAKLRATVLAQDARGYVKSPNVYGKTEHAQAPTS